MQYWLSELLRRGGGRACGGWRRGRSSRAAPSTCSARARAGRVRRGGRGGRLARRGAAADGSARSRMPGRAHGAASFSESISRPDRAPRPGGTGGLSRARIRVTGPGPDLGSRSGGVWSFPAPNRRPDGPGSGGYAARGHADPRRKGAAAAMTKCGAGRNDSQAQGPAVRCGGGSAASAPAPRSKLRYPSRHGGSDCGDVSLRRARAYGGEEGRCWRQGHFAAGRIGCSASRVASDVN